MNIQELFQSITDRVQTTANVKTVYGEPIAAEGKTIIPVARVRYGFGGGGGLQVALSTDSEEQDDPDKNAGGGGGGGVEVTPVGIIEITETETRYISFEDRRRVIRALLLVSLLGLFAWWRKRPRGSSDKAPA